MFAAAHAVLERATAERAFPAAVVEVGTSTQAVWTVAVGRLTYESDAAAASTDTVFDLASLTKVLATTPLVMQQVERGALELGQPISSLVPAWRAADRAGVTVRDFLSHSSGLPGYRPLYLDHHGEDEYAEAIAALSLEYEPRARSLYSDLDFILLGVILGGAHALPDRVATLCDQIGIADPLQYLPPVLWRPRMAPTEVDVWRGRLLVGEVHDENAAALGGVAGHAGLFGTAAAVGAMARHLLQVLGGRVGAFRRDTLETFITRRTDVPGSSRALGWDTMLPTSSCGTRMSPRAFGHTGFTGTSLWIDPDRGAYVVLLTNRVYPTRSNNAIRAVRSALHDAVMDSLDKKGE